MNANRKSLQQIFAMLIAIAVISGCDTDSMKNPVEPGFVVQSEVPTLSRNVAGVPGPKRIDDETPDPPTGCTTSSGVIPADNAYTLSNLGSLVCFPSESVPFPTAVSFDICDLNTTSTGFAPKAQVFGPDLNFTYLKGVRVDLSLEDAGLPSSTPALTDFSVYRWTLAGDWVFHKRDKVLGGGIVRYWIVQNGTYVISLDSTPASTIDTSWSATGNVDPTTGGTLDLLNSSLTVPPGAVNTLTNVTFSITAARPQGLPTAFERIYEFGPEGTVFQTPVTLDVAFSDAGRTGITSKFLTVKLYYFNESTSTWVPERDAQIDWANQRIVVELNHFSRYAFAR